jgi:hypothetical protein
MLKCFRSLRSCSTSAADASDYFRFESVSINSVLYSFQYSFDLPDKYTMENRAVTIISFEDLLGIKQIFRYVRMVDLAADKDGIRFPNTY